MSTSKADREYAMWRAFRSIDIANELGCDMIVLWLAREGTLCAESKSPVWATKMLIEAIIKMLTYENSYKHLENNLKIFTALEKKVDRFELSHEACS